MSNREKWESYHAGANRPPWESGLSVSHFVHAIEDGSLRAEGIALDVGCGSGVSTVYFAQLGRFSHCVGVDISSHAIRKAHELAASLSVNTVSLPDFDSSSAVSSSSQPVLVSPAASPSSSNFSSDSNPSQLSFAECDLLDSSSSARVALRGRCTSVFDCQTFHALRAGRPSEAAHIAHALADFLLPGGRLLVVAGNANEPSRLTPGPSRLTRHELLDPFTIDVDGPRLRLVSLHESRFDPTPTYGEVPPLAWVAIFERPIILAS